MSNTHTSQRELNICCGCRRSRFMWKRERVCVSFGWLRSQQRQSQSRQKNKASTFQKKSSLPRVVHSFLLNTTENTSIVTWSLWPWERGNTGANHVNNWKVSGAQNSSPTNLQPPSWVQWWKTIHHLVEEISDLHCHQNERVLEALQASRIATR